MKYQTEIGDLWICFLDLFSVSGGLKFTLFISRSMPLMNAGEGTPPFLLYDLLTHSTLSTKVSGYTISNQKLFHKLEPPQCMSLLKNFTTR